MSAPTFAPWAGAFGDAYTQRNREAGRDRHRFWLPFVAKYGFGSAFEAGCSHGTNLDWFNLAGVRHTRGVDANPSAVAIARSVGHEVRIGDARDARLYSEDICSLAFCAGVLIHQPTVDDAKAVVLGLAARADDYVLLIEHHADVETPVAYRVDEPGAPPFFKRPYGTLAAEWLGPGFALLESGPVDGWPPGAHTLTHWLFERKTP